MALNCSPTDDAPLSTAAARPPLVVISTHLDDAVLSCGRLIAANPRTEVVTVFTAGKDDWSEPAEWDRSCGFKPGEDVMAARRAEDRRALAVLGASAVWLDALQLSYGGRPVRREALAEALSVVLQRLDPAAVACPAGLVHDEHVVVRAASLDLVRRHPDRRWLLYADLPYGRSNPAALDVALTEVRAAGFTLTPAAAPGRGAYRKWRAMQRYPSQRRGLGRSAWRQVRRAERYWHLAPS